MKYLIQEKLIIDNWAYEFHITENYRAGLLISDLDGVFKSSTSASINEFVLYLIDMFPYPNRLPKPVIKMCKDIAIT